MPKLDKTQIPEIKLDTAAASIEGSLSAEQRRGLFESPGTVVVAIVELTSKSYTGHADGEEKDPQVKVRVTGAEVARTDEEAASLLEAKRAMYRGRRMDGTLDEIGNGPRGAENVLAREFAGYPTEAEFRAAEAEKQARSRTEFVR
ncbi:hypothetical protein LHJ74_14490 [Streptomyces sp. N2-109]|uniref:Uncharacterized protein n=1 Tax=Streptomyces gossypii TaxID=2883101 RepID=A0ABT2JT75_9ACTN|nr:hypothetical protein [Streptomyces gossypii]MCT2591102.1 hypothetical protein [Streptomyces gossypii]